MTPLQQVNKKRAAKATALRTKATAARCDAEQAVAAAKSAKGAYKAARKIYKHARKIAKEARKHLNACLRKLKKKASPRARPARVVSKTNAAPPPGAVETPTVRDDGSSVDSAARER